MNNLTSLTLNYIRQNYSTKDWLFSNPQTYEFFKQFAINNRTLPPKKISIAKAPMPPLPKIIIEKPEEKKIEIEIETKKTIAIDPKPRLKSKESAYNDIRQILQNKFPTFSIINEIPINSKNQSALVALVSSDNDITTTSFLKKLQTAIQENLSPAEIIEPNEKNSDYKLIITTEGTEIPDCGIKTICLKPIASYIQNQKLKAELWNELKSLLR